MDEIARTAKIMEQARTKRDKAILKAYEANQPVSDIAAAAGLSVRGVYALLARHQEEA